MERQELRMKTCEQLEVENLYDEYNVESGGPLKGFGGANKAGSQIFSESCRRRIAKGELSFSFLRGWKTGQLVLDFRKYGRGGVLPRSPLCHHYHPPSCCFMTIS